MPPDIFNPRRPLQTPFKPRTGPGPLATLIDRVGVEALESAELMVAIDTDTGHSSYSAITGDMGAAMREALGSLFEHLLDATNDPRITTFLIQARAEAGL